VVVEEEATLVVAEVPNRLVSLAAAAEALLIPEPINPILQESIQVRE